MSEDDRTTIIPLVEETATVSVQDAVIGRVRVSTTTETIEEVVRQNLRTMSAAVVRKPINRTLDQGEAPPGPRTEGDVMIVPIFEEILIVEKRLVLREELHITQHLTTERVEVPMELRRQQARVERLPADDASIPGVTDV
ncbi:YsnF/AvaK domain-containing protein [Amaricoccus sp. W119]|uniref:YsnF/AvaK domain-containing protein n=1 Tax=Amaricoccus sp. W119 TaxID=3391833 RepID=UPI0039A63FD2